MAVVLHLCEELCDYELIILVKLSPDMFDCLRNVQISKNGHPKINCSKG